MVLSSPVAHPTALWVVPVSDLGGVARHVLDVVRAGLPGYRLVVLCPPGALVDAVTHAGGAVLEAPFGPEHGLRDSVAALRRAVRALRPAVVHSHLSYADIVAAIATPRGPLLVTTEHGIAADDAVYHASRPQAELMARVHQLRLRRFDRVIAVSTATRQAMRDKWHPRQPVVVIPNGVDPPAPVPPTAGLRVLSLSRLAPEKRLSDLVSAFALVAQDRREATLTIAGVGPDEERLRRQVRASALTDRVTFAGFVDATAALGAADVVVQLSVWENCSYTLLDAVAHGLGVVASPAGGNLEILQAQCFAEPADHDQVANRIIQQGTDLNARSALPDPWPTTADMALLISRAYEVRS